MRRVVVLTFAMLGGCAGVTFQQLNPDLSARANAPKGAVYYMPKPYLLVAQLPAGSAGGGSGPVSQEVQVEPPEGGASGDGNASTATGGAEAKAEPATAAASAPSSSDQSFGATSAGYVVKLVYLPDMSRPMSLSVHAGFGTASLKPTLQNGWMLTGFDAQADSKATELFGSLSSLLTAYKTPGKAPTGGGAPETAGAARPILAPGLYSFRYDPQGALTGLCPVTVFGPDGPVAPVSKPPGC